ncbi:unnamed protein product [Microthlaspi erraticum]|uniref:Uncharacterized protein n=1 Tax=Microthlaspi erraticum TaxID=1685480 RepID=A0A6D2JDN9_9BRAS|nr:unnamed protein product [Microthlaspi erraticum]
MTSKNAIKMEPEEVQISPPAKTQADTDNTSKNSKSPKTEGVPSPEAEVKIDVTPSEIEEADTDDDSCEKEPLLKTTELPVSTGAKFAKTHTLKGSIRQPLVPVLHNVEEKPTDPDERVLNFAARAHELLRWAIGSAVIFVPIKFIADAQKKEEEKPLGVYHAILNALQGFNFAYPFILFIVIYGLFHLVAAYIADPAKARILEWLSLLFGFGVLASVIFYAGVWVFVWSIITAIVVLGAIKFVFMCCACAGEKDETIDV